MSGQTVRYVVAERRLDIEATIFILFLVGLILLVGGAELLVRGASSLAAAAGVSPLIVGLTVVAFGTSAPELAVSVRSALSSQAAADIAIGNIVGSNICNVLLVLGLAAVISPLSVSTRLVRQDVPIMIIISVMLGFFALDGNVGLADGLCLFGGVVAFTLFTLQQGRRESALAVAEESAPQAAGAGRWVPDLGSVVAGLALLLLGSSWLIRSAVSIAQSFGVSELVIGLTLIALGTSLPEVATSVMASFRGQRDLAVGNVVGSNIFNILAVLGATAIVAPDGVRVAPAVLRFDLPVMMAVSVACLPIFFTGFVVSRFEGLAFLGCYAAYAGYLALAAQQHDALPTLSKVMWLFVIALIVLTLATMVARQVRR